MKRMRLPLWMPRRLCRALGRVIWPLEVTVASITPAGVVLRDMLPYVLYRFALLAVRD